MAVQYAQAQKIINDAVLQCAGETGCCAPITAAFRSKAIVRLFPPLERRMRTTENSTAPVSTASIRWGLQGISDGQADHDRCNQSAASLLFNGDIYSFGSSYY
jgi:hypothetical protein